MLNYIRQNKIRHSIIVGLLVIAIIVNSNSLSCVCLLVAQFMFFLELFFIDTYFEKNKLGSANEYNEHTGSFLVPLEFYYDNFT